LQAKLSGYPSVYDEPIPCLRGCNTIPDAPICGGGKLTLAVDGTHRKVNYHFSKSDFWSIVLKPEVLFQKYHIRQASLCSLSLTVHNASGNPEHFRHVQDLAGAGIHSDLPLEGGVLRVHSLALAQRDLALLELEASGTAASVTVELDTVNEHENFFILKGIENNETVWLRKEHSSMMTFNACAALRAMGAENVQSACDPSGGVSLSFDVKPGHSVRLLLSVKGGKDHFHHREQALAVLAGMSAADLPELIEAHAAWWRSFWTRSTVDLGDPILERFYYGALYVHGCSIDLDARAVPGLAGGWITHPDPIWGGTYTMNYNGEAPFWGLVSSNRGEWILPYARVCLDYIPSGRRLARRLGTQGMVMPVMIGPWGVADNDDALGQKGNASLAALTMIWHYEFSRQREFLEKFLYPYLSELTEFWEDNVSLDESGRYVIAESAARERTPGDLNPGPELGYLRKILSAAITCSEELDVDTDRRERWRDILHRLSDFPTREVDGGLCYMEAENRREISMSGVGDNPVVLDHVYPGGGIDHDPSGRGRLIARNTLRYLDSWNQGNGFPRIFSQAVRAEWPGGDLLDRFTRRLTRGPGPHEMLRRNHTFLPEDHSYEGVGAIEFIHTMLATCHSGVLTVFHVWPKERDASFAQLRVQGAFLVSGELKGGEVTRVELLSEQGGVCRFKSCWPGKEVEVEKLGCGRIAVAEQSDAGVYAWETEAGSYYRITAGVSVDVAEPNPPAMLVPIIDPAAATRRKYTDAALDILLTPEIRSTRVEIEVVYADESRRRCTAECRFNSRADHIAAVDSRGVITGAGRGPARVDVAAVIDGERLACSLLVYVLPDHIITDVRATMGGKPWKNWNSHMHSLECLVGGAGTDGPGLSALHRANSYGHGLFALDVVDGEAWVQCDLGAVQALDEMWIWNYNCPDDYRVLWWNGGTSCGMRDVTLEYSADGETWEELKTDGYPFRLAKASGTPWMPATNLEGTHHPIRFGGVKARYVKLAPNPAVGTGNWGGPHFGLSKVRFTHVKP
jgi:hypothetical protein